MKIEIHPVTAILTSAYLSAMLTSSVTPIRSNATLAAAVDPSAAQEALKGAMSGLDAAGWAAAVTDIPSPSQPTSKFVTVSATGDPILSEELLARLLAFTKINGAESVVRAKVTKAFGLNDGTADIPVRQVSEPLPEGKHFLSYSTVPGSRDIFIAFSRADKTRADIYLTDKTGVLRAAVIVEPGVTRLITNEQASEKYKAELELFAKLAKDLPPATPGNS